MARKITLLRLKLHSCFFRVTIFLINMESRNFKEMQIFSRVCILEQFDISLKYISNQQVLLGIKSK